MSRWRRSRCCDAARPGGLFDFKPRQWLHSCSSAGRSCHVAANGSLLGEAGVPGVRGAAAGARRGGESRSGTTRVVAELSARRPRVRGWRESRGGRREPAARSDCTRRLAASSRAWSAAAALAATGIACGSRLVAINPWVAPSRGGAGGNAATIARARTPGRRLFPDLVLMHHAFSHSMTASLHSSF